MVKIRLTRGGAPKRAFYRVTVIDSRKKREGRPLEFIGYYDPKPGQEVIHIDVEAADRWVAKGAQLSDTVRTLIARARRRAASAAGAA